MLKNYFSTFNERMVFLDETKKGYPAAWEAGGGMTSTGKAFIICGPAGEKLTPVYVRRRGSLACGHHALFIIEPGYWFVQADHHRGDFRIILGKVASIDKHKGEYSDRIVPVAIISELYQFDEGEWNIEPPVELTAAIHAAKEKATCYHCRSPHYAAI